MKKKEEKVLLKILNDIEGVLTSLEESRESLSQRMNRLEDDEIQTQDNEINKILLGMFSKYTINEDLAYVICPKKRILWAMEKELEREKKKWFFCNQLVIDTFKSETVKLKHEIYKLVIKERENDHIQINCNLYHDTDIDFLCNSTVVCNEFLNYLTDLGYSDFSDVKSNIDKPFDEPKSISVVAKKPEEIKENE